MKSNLQAQRANVCDVGFQGSAAALERE